MKEIIRKGKKAFHRLYRIITFRKGIYGKYGKGCVFQRGSYLDDESVIGTYNYIGKGTTIDAARIGNYCSLGEYVAVGPGEHPVDEISTCCRILDGCGTKYNLVSKPVIIGNDVWIGTKAIILRGVRIADGAVIAGGAVVKKDIPPYAIVAGVPARIIRYRKSEDDISKIIASKWWDYPINEAIEIVKAIR